MNANQVMGAESNAHKSPAPQRALVIGGGPAAAVAARALADMGADVTFARVGAKPMLFQAAPDGTGDLTFDPTPDLTGVTVRGVEAPPLVTRANGGFHVAFSDGSAGDYAAVVVAAGVALRPKPDGTPTGVELFTPEFDVRSPSHMSFIFDYDRLSDPAPACAATKAATVNAAKGGSSSILFRHAAVPHLYGESILEEARDTGVRFIRYADKPTIRSSDRGFEITVTDVIDVDENVTLNPDRVILVTGPDPSSVPAWLRASLGPGEMDSEGFALSDSVHSNMGHAFGSGLFMIGEATGNVDFSHVMAQAQAAASAAQAWMRTSRGKASDQPMTISCACVGCLTCYRICPHGAITVRAAMGRPSVESWGALCRECGICAAVCPSGAIDIKRSPDADLLASIKAVESEEMATTVFVFGCQRSAGFMAPNIEMPETVRFIPVPCAGRIGEHVLWAALAAGAKGVLVVGCHHGNCASNTGTDWAAARVRRGVKAGILPGDTPRLGYVTVASNEAARFRRLLTDFVEGLPPRV